MAIEADRSACAMTGPMLGSVTPERGFGSRQSSPKNYASCGPPVGSWRRPKSARSAKSLSAAGPLLNRWVMRNQRRQRQQQQQQQHRYELDDEKHAEHLQLPTEEDDAMPRGSYQQLDDWVAGQYPADSLQTYMIKKDHLRSKSADAPSAEPTGFVPQLTREEFEALPVAIQRKFFSTLERLRFAQDSGIDGISRHYDAISTQNLKSRRNSRFVDRVVSDQYPALNRHQSLRDSQSPRRPPLAASTNAANKAYKRSTQERYTREQEVALAKRLRTSVILDAADEAIYKIGRRASQYRYLDPLDLTPSLAASGSMTSSRHSMESHNTGSRSMGPPSPPPKSEDSFSSSFRWLEEDDDLDLTLALDDYHAGIRESLPSPTSNQRPSFRRRISINKIPFGRGSVSTSRPGTTEATATATTTAPQTNSPPQTAAPFDSSANAATTSFLHGRRRSRGLSLITPGSRNVKKDSVGSVDSSAAHYQDPEARLKLRVYLASPQKFDEAVEFGFPSSDVLSAGAAPSPYLPELTGMSHVGRYQAQQKLSQPSSAGMRTFLDDDDELDMLRDDLSLATGSDAPSLTDPDSPRTPQNFEDPNGAQPPAAMLGSCLRPATRALTDTTFARPSHKARQLSEGGSAGYAQAPASSREMTLRMTLTRPDLRADEEQIYAWQQPSTGSNARRPINTASSAGDSACGGNVAYIGHDGPGTSYNAKENIDRVFAGLEQPAENKGMKRFWNRVKRN